MSDLILTEQVRVSGTLITGAISSAAATISTAMDRQTAAIVAQTKVFEDLVRFLIGPEYDERDFGSAEEDKIDDSAGILPVEQQAKDDILQQWRDDGYPDEVLKYFE